MENLPDTTPFDVWNQKKKLIHSQHKAIYFREREVWWCSLGINIGSEQNGKNAMFERPIIIIKRFSTDLIWIIPLTTSSKKNLFNVEIFGLGIKQSAVISHFKSISPKRLLRKVATLSDDEYEKVLRAIIGIFPQTKPPHDSGGISEPEGSCEVIIPPEDQL